MKRHFALSSATSAAILVVVSMSLAAKDPSPRVLAGRGFVPTVVAPIGSLTPPPKEWAMFPQDEAPAQAPQAPQAPPPGQNGNAPSAGNGPGGGTDGLVGIVSTANVRPAPVSHRELPLFWLMVTGALSFCAVLTCGNLVLRKSDDDLAQGSAADGDIPVVSEAQEIRA